MDQLEEAVNSKASDLNQSMTEAEQRLRLDVDHLRRYTLDDKVLEAELLGLFRVQARVQLDLISIASLPADYQLAVHTLKGAALVIGAKAIVACTRELEALGFPANATRRRQLISRLADEISATDAEIAKITA
jgi:HPt (histidine-containing phosphotransfer) domain-containing protein